MTMKTEWNDSRKEKIIEFIDKNFVINTFVTQATSMFFSFSCINLRFNLRLTYLYPRNGQFKI